MESIDVMKSAVGSRSRAHRFDEVPKAELEGDAVALDRPDQVAQQLGIVPIPRPLLQAALHCHPHHLPLGFTLQMRAVRDATLSIAKRSTLCKS